MADGMLNVALKEWDLVVQAVLRGEQAILLRKEGILESEGEFVLEHQRFLFFPTFVHQTKEGVKEGYRDKVVSVREEPERVTVSGWGEVVRILEVPGREQMDRLDDLHLWGKALIDMRFGYRPEKPLYVVVVKGWRLPKAVEIINTAAYAGCKSWVPLEEQVELAGSVAAMEDEALSALVERIEKALVNPG